QYFYRYQQNRVQTPTAFHELYLAEDAKDEGVSHVQKDFPDTVKWFPDLRTGPDGMVKVTVRLPDSLTTWRATARGHTLKTQVGTGVAKVICSKDLFVRLETPRCFTQEDHSVVSHLVQHATP